MAAKKANGSKQDHFLPLKFLHFTTVRSFQFTGFKTLESANLSSLNNPPLWGELVIYLGSRLVTKLLNLSFRNVIHLKNGKILQFMELYPIPRVEGCVNNLY
jgi:hypothetical protein